jgi:Predicted NADH:ubiquinone oxidoreductase, subunit RnfC
MGLQPWKLNGHIKGILGKNRVKNTLHNKPDSANPFNELKRYPTSKLIRQLDLEQYDVDAPIEDIIINAEKVILPLGQNVGAVSAAVVKVGDMVKKGQLIAKIPEGALGANLHASIDGIVTELDDRQITISKL